MVIGPPSLSSNQGSEGCLNVALGATCHTTLAQLTVPSNPPVILTAPSDGVIRSWSVYGAVDSGDLTNDGFFLRVLHPAPGPYTGEAVSPTNLEPAPPGAVATATVNMPIHGGDYIGVDASHTNGGGGYAKVFYSNPGGTTVGRWNSGLANGATAFPTSTVPNERLQLNATIELSVPVVSSVSPASGPPAGGERVTIAGQHLANATNVRFGSAAATIRSNSNSEITVDAPPHAPGVVDVIVTGPGGDSVAASGDRYTYPGPVDATAPVISGFGLSPSAFVAANTGPSVVPAAVVGTRVAYSLSESGTTTLTVERRTRGVKKAHKCVAGRPHKGKKPCTRYVGVKGSTEHQDATGANAFRFMGRIGGKSLKPGQYRLVAVARDDAGNPSAPARNSFRIKR